MADSEAIKAVTFDAGGTLIHLVEPVGESYSRVAAEFGFHAQPDALDGAFRKVWKQTPPPFSSGKVETEKSWWKSLVAKVFADCLDSDDFKETSVQFDQFFDRLYDYFAEPGVWTLDPDAPELFDELQSRGIRMGIISNFDSRLLQILDDLQVLPRFEPVIISNDIKVSKPEPGIFRHAIELLGLPANQILHVGDDPVCDLAGAEAVGMQAVLVGSRYGKLNGIMPKLPLAKE